jgi:hypothetical protein
MLCFLTRPKASMSSPHRTLKLIVLAALLALGCAEVDNPYRRFPEPDFDEFVTEVQPVLTEHCASVGCHGSPDRALTLFAVGFLRARASFPGAPLDEGGLAPAELTWNYDALRMRLMDETDPDASRLLLKCLDPAAGGISHAEGFVAFDDRDDRGYRVLRDWIAGGLP